MYCLILILGIIAAFTSVYGPRWFLWISAISSFAGGYIIGEHLIDSGDRWLPGILIGIILCLLAIWTGVWTRYYSRKGREKLKRGYRQLKNITFNKYKSKDS